MPDRPQSQYNYSFQFDEAMRRATARLHRTHPSLRPWTIAFIAYTVIMGAGVTLWPLGRMAGLFSWTTAPWVPAFFHLFYWPVFIIYIRKVSKRFDAIRYIIEHRICLECGYEMVSLPLDDDWCGRCPECGHQYSLGEYVHPRHPKRYALDIELDGPPKDA
jgi:hypothetical protein